VLPAITPAADPPMHSDSAPSTFGSARSVMLLTAPPLAPHRLPAVLLSSHAPARPRAQPSPL